MTLVIPDAQPTEADAMKTRRSSGRSTRRASVRQHDDEVLAALPEPRRVGHGQRARLRARRRERVAVLRVIREDARLVARGANGEFRLLARVDLLEERLVELARPLPTSSSAQHGAPQLLRRLHQLLRLLLERGDRGFLFLEGVAQLADEALERRGLLVRGVFLLLQGRELREGRLDGVADLD